MAGKKGKSGRKPRGQGPAEHFNTRIAPEIRRRLERDAKKNKRSLSREIELRLADSIHAASEAGDQTRALCYLITQVAKVAQAAEQTSEGEPFNWRTNRFDFESFKLAIGRLLEEHAPVGEIGASRYTLFRDAEDMGRTTAAAVLTYLRSDSADLIARGERHGAPSGSLFYAYPQAAAALAQPKTGKSGVVR